MKSKLVYLLLYGLSVPTLCLAQDSNVKSIDSYVSAPEATQVAEAYSAPETLTKSDILQLFRLPEEVVFAFLNLTNYPNTVAEAHDLMVLLATRNAHNYEAPSTLTCSQMVLNTLQNIEDAYYLAELQVRSRSYTPVQFQATTFQSIDAETGRFRGKLVAKDSSIFALHDVQTQAVFQIIEKDATPDSLERAYLRYLSFGDDSQVLISALPNSVKTASEEELRAGIATTIQLPKNVYDQEAFAALGLQVVYLGQINVSAAGAQQLRQLNGRAVELKDPARQRAFDATCALSANVALVPRIHRWEEIRELILTSLLDFAVQVQNEVKASKTKATADDTTASSEVESEKPATVHQEETTGTTDTSATDTNVQQTSVEKTTL